MQLVINSFGASLRRQGDRFVVRVGTRKQAFAAAKVRTILITTAVHLSSDVLLLAIENSIEVVLPDKFGELIARVRPPRSTALADKQARTRPSRGELRRPQRPADVSSRCGDSILHGPTG
jgi:CRISPR/Cas system-associated endonuclease Cas1